MDSAEDHEAADPADNATAESSTTTQANPGADVSCLQWIEALELQVVGACRSDERLRPSLRWNVSCFGSDGRLLAHLGQHFKARELVLLARCLCTPVVSLRVGKVSCHGRYLYPTSKRGYLNLMLLPCSEMQLVFADDVGTVERVAVTIPGLESGGLLIEALKEDASQRTFILRDYRGKITNYFWQSEKIKSIGDKLIAKIRNMLKRKPTLAHLTGIDEGKLDLFADYLRTAIFSKTSSTLAPSTQNHKFSPKPKLIEFPSKDLLNCTSLESSMENLRQCMQEIDSFLCPNSPLQMLARTLPATNQLIESLKRLRQCLHALATRRSNRMTNIEPMYIRKRPLLVILCKTVTPLNALFENNCRLTIVNCDLKHLPLERSLGPLSLDCGLKSALVNQIVVKYPSGQYCPSTMKHFRLHKPLVFNCRSILREFFTHVVSQMLAIISRLPNGVAYTHKLYMLLFALGHCGDNSISYLNAFMAHLQCANFGGCYGTNTWRLLPMHMNHVENGVIVHNPSVGSGWKRLIGDDYVFQNGRRKMEECGASCRKCIAETRLSNLVLINFYVQETWLGLRMVTAEITSGNISYIVVGVAHRCSTSLFILKVLSIVHI